MCADKRSQMPIIGWREWVGLPDFCSQKIKAKVDTGARSSSLHAFGIKTYEQAGQMMVQFELHPLQRSSDNTVQVECEVLEFRNVKSSNGKVTERPVILTRIELLGKIWSIELTLANRDEMGFRMLLGREAFRNSFLVDAGRSYYGGQPVRKKKKKHSNKSKLKKSNK